MKSKVLSYLYLQSDEQRKIIVAIKELLELDETIFKNIKQLYNHLHEAYHKNKKSFPSSNDLFCKEDFYNENQKKILISITAEIIPKIKIINDNIDLLDSKIYEFNEFISNSSKKLQSTKESTGGKRRRRQRKTRKQRRRRHRKHRKSRRMFGR